MDNKRITENELILPSLYLMDSSDGKITTSSLIKQLTNIMNPKGLDAEILNNRNDTYFSQKVRNLKSHDTLIKSGYATYNDGIYSITDEGRNLVQQNKESLLYIFSADFDYEDVKYSAGRIYSHSKQKITVPYMEIITEGGIKTVVNKVANRSKKLRKAAIEHFTHDGIIKCDCCNFEFKSFYGNKYGSSCIEIHHLKPILQYAEMDETQTIEAALQNLLPVCPNCHRVIHKNHITYSKIASFKDEIIKNNS